MFNHYKRTYLHPQGGALAHGSELRRLVVREAEGREGAVLRGESLHDGQELDQLAPEEEKGIADLNDVGVVADEAGRCSQVDDGHRLAEAAAAAEVATAEAAAAAEVAAAEVAAAAAAATTVGVGEKKQKRENIKKCILRSLSEQHPARFDLYVHPMYLSIMRAVGNRCVAACDIMVPATTTTPPPS